MNGAPSLTIIIPTAGRPTLSTTLETLAPQVHAEDQILVVGDGQQPLARRLVVGLTSPPWHYFEHGPTRDTGRSQRELAIARATGDYLCFMDDDDVFTDGALDTIRARARAHPRRPLMFRMEDRFGTILWRVPQVAYANVSGHMLVVPNLAGKIGRWDKNDFDFIVQTLALQGEPVWLEDVIAVLRPHLPRPSATG
jgi:glycosyltransferase involved in cell wall biosynthesis